MLSKCCAPMLVFGGVSYNNVCFPLERLALCVCWTPRNFTRVERSWILVVIYHIVHICFINKSKVLTTLFSCGPFNIMSSILWSGIIPCGTNLWQGLRLDIPLRENCKHILQASPSESKLFLVVPMDGPIAARHVPSNVLLSSSKEITFNTTTTIEFCLANFQ